MSLNAALSVASGSLQAIQTQLAVASSNVSNADVEGYSRKTVTKTSLATAGAGTGVAVTSITSSVDPWLLKSIYSATATSSASATLSDYLQEPCLPIVG
jgi:flagellar hook-associated protein 1